MINFVITSMNTFENKQFDDPHSFLSKKVLNYGKYTVLLQNYQNLQIESSKYYKSLLLA